MNLRKKYLLIRGQYDTIQIHSIDHHMHYKFLFVNLFLLVGITFGQSQLTLPGSQNPHHGGDCTICHTPDQEPARDTYIPDACLKCHSAGVVDADIHPLYHLNLKNEKIKIPADFPLVNSDSLTCITCHSMPVKYDRSNASFLRGGPYKEELDFCYQCHARKDYQKMNPHLKMIAADGSVDRAVCQVCHLHPPNPNTPAKVAREMATTMEGTCNKCHALHTHEKNHWGIDIYKVNKNILAQFKRSERDYNITLPLSPDRKIQCNTCHYVHGELGIDAVAYGGPGDNQHFLRLPQGKLCYMCHNK